MSIVVQFSYEELIINALNRIKHKRGDDCITRSVREFDAIRAVLQPLYDEVAKLRKADHELREGIGYAMGELYADAFDDIRDEARHLRNHLHGTLIAADTAMGIDPVAVSA